MNYSKQREIILKTINESYDHPTAYQVYEKCKFDIPNISLGTIYRNLNSLLENKLIRSIKISDIERFDKILDEHDHFICEECKKIFDIKLKTDFYNTDTNFKVTSHSLNLFGNCPKCIKKEED